MNEQTSECPYCGSSIPEGSTECSECGKEIEGETPRILNALTSISGVGNSRAKNIVESGFSEVDDIEDIDVQGLESIEGIGESTAEDIIEEIEETTDEEGNLYICDACGAFVSEDSSSCSNCGAQMEIAEEDTAEGKSDSEEDVDEVQEEDERDTNGSEEEEDDGSLYLCENCGSFVSADTEVCPTCGAQMTPDEEEEDIEKERPSGPEDDEPEEDIEEDIEQSEGSEEEDDGLFLCDNCGAFVDSSADECPTCGYHFDEIEEETVEEQPPEIEEEAEADIKEELEKEIDTEIKGQPEEEEIEEISDEDLASAFEQEIETEMEEEELERSTEKEITEEVPEEGLASEFEQEIETEVEKEMEEDFSSPQEEEIKDEDEMKVSKTVDPVLLGEDRKMCSNCGYISEENADVCGICGRSFSEEETVREKEIEETKGEKLTTEEQEETLKTAFGVENIPDTAKVDVKEDEGEDVFDYCTVCGAFIAEGEERCPVCGSLKSEMEESGLEEQEEEEVFEGAYRPTDRGEDISICEVCGAFIEEEQQNCPICGSNLGKARREIEEYEGEEAIQKDVEEDVQEFFGDTEGIELEENLDTADLYLCNSCGAMLSEEADVCSICGADVSENNQELESPDDAHELFIEEKEEVEEVTTDEELTPEEDRIEEVEERSTEEEFENIDVGEETDEIEREIETSVESSAEGEELEGENEVARYIDEETPDDTEEELGALLDELEDEKRGDLEEVSERIEDIDMSQEDLSKPGTTDTVEDKTGAETLDHEEVKSLLSEIENNIDEKSTKEKEIDETTGIKKEGSEEWKKCPVCDSHIDVESDYCSVCETSLKDHPYRTPEQETKLEEEKLEVDVSDIQSTTDEIKAEKGVLKSKKSSEKKVKSAERSTPQYESSSTGSYVSEMSSGLENMMSKAKNYEVPVSSLSLLAFGGVYLSTYGRADFSYFAEIGIALLGIFFGLGFLTFFILKEDFLSDSKIALSGYLLGIALSGFVPIQTYILGWRLPIYLNVVLVSLALGLFWMFDFELPENHSFLLWFAGITILLIVSTILGLGSINLELTNLDYPLLLPLGLGSTLVVGSTVSWYRQAKQKESLTDQHIPEAQQNLKIMNYGSGSEDEEEALDSEAVSYYSRGVAYVQVGDYRKAIKNFREALESNEENEKIWCNLGAVYSRLGNQEKAKEALQKGLDLEKGYELAWNNLGNAHYRAGEYEEALKCYDRALEINDSYRDARANKSQVLIKLGEY